MNTTATSEPTPAAEVPLNRAAKEELLRQMYSRAHWIELIRLIGYQSVPMDKARQAIKPLSDQYGKEPMASACEVMVEIFTQDKEAFARLKPHIRRMAFQILGPEPLPSAVTPTVAGTAPTPDPHTDAEQPRRVTTRKANKPAKPQAATNGAPASAESVSRDALMQQYRAAKEKHPDMLLLFRMGDFFELFDQDAETAHRLLGLTLTTRAIALAPTLAKPASRNLVGTLVGRCGY